jgi:RNA polymerase sigma-70 factor (ECF subfamily)
MSSDMEHSLLARARAGDGDAFGQLVEPALGMFYGGILRILGEPADAQDALQEALLTLHAQLHRFEGKSKFSTWAYRVCINEALMFRRSKVRRREDALDDFLPRFQDDGHHMDMDTLLAWSQEAEALDMAQHLQLRAKVTEGLALLSDDQRAVFVLRDLEGWDTDEVARHLGLSRDLVRQRLHRARIGLRGYLKDFSPGRVVP